MEPLFRALYATQPSFDITSVDLVTDRNNLRKLLSFVNPRLGRKRTFSIVAEAVHGCGTVIFRRVEPTSFFEVGGNSPQSVSAPINGYGHAFEKAYTTNRVEGSTGHHRIVSYQFGGLNLVVRYETDGCVGGGSQEEKTLEIKTRMARKKIGLPEILPQLWLAQTRKLVRAYHTDGLFDCPDVEDVALECKTWEDMHQEDLRRLVEVVKQVTKVVRAGTNGGRAIIKYDDRAADKLLVVEDDGPQLFPDDLYRKFERSVRKRRQRQRQEDEESM